MTSKKASHLSAGAGNRSKVSKNPSSNLALPGEGTSKSKPKIPMQNTSSTTTTSKNAPKKTFAFEEEEEITPRSRKLTRIATKALHRFDKKGISNFTKLANGIASTVLSAYLGFRDPKKRRREYLIPKDKAAWLEWLVYVARKNVNVEYLTDKELRKVIIRARPNLTPHKKGHEIVQDPALPSCIEWDENQVGDWIESMGWPHLRETFVRNYITGRRLVLIDCAALNKMGMNDLDAMREVAGKIRELLGTPPPNALRPIMRVAPYERFLRRKVYNGRSYDEMTFEKFCQIEGFNFDIINENKNAQIPCTCEVIITTPAQAEADDDGEGEEDDEDHSLKNAPTVEYLVRNAIVRNKTIDDIMRDILENVFLPPRERKYGKEVWGTLKRGLGEGYDDLHLHYPKDRLQFASGVAHHLIDELYKTVAILNDISQLEKHIKEDISPEDVEMLQHGAMVLMEEAAPIASLLALGELDLESIFRTEPTFEHYVDDVVHEAEKKTNELVPDASAFVDEVISEAWRKIPEIDLEGLDPELRGSILRMANGILHGISQDRDDIVDKVVGGRGEKRENVVSPKLNKGKDAKLTFATPQQTRQRKQSNKPNISASANYGGGRPSQPGGDVEKVKDAQGTHATSEQTKGKEHQGGHTPTEHTKAHTPPEQTKGKDQLTRSSRTNIHKNQLRRESRKSISKSPAHGTEEEGGVKESSTDISKQGKGKESKGKKEDHVQAPPTQNEGEGEGRRASLEADGGGGEQGQADEQGKTLKETPNITINMAHVELDKKQLILEHPGSAGRSKPSTAMSLNLRLATPERSPLPRSPMTVSTPTEHHSGRNSPNPRTPMTPMTLPGTANTRLDSADGSKRTRTAGSFGSLDGEGGVFIQSRTTTPIINVALSQQHKKPTIAGPVRQPPAKPQPVVPKVNKTLQDVAAIKPLLEAKNAHPPSEAELSATIHGPPPPAEGISPRQGKALPPSQQVYNQLQQQQMLRQQHQMGHGAPGGRALVYHQKQGVLLEKGEKNPTVREVFDQTESTAPVQQQQQLQLQESNASVAAASKSSKKLTNFVLIPKLLRLAHHQKPNAAALAPQVTSSGTKVSSRKSIDVRTQDPKRKTFMSDSAEKIWEQMKEQVETGKREDADANKSMEAVKSKSNKDIPSTSPRKFSVDEGSMPRRSRMYSMHPDMLIDHAHIMEMKEHRDALVENWAKKQSMMDPLEPSVTKEERMRIVRVTADKVVTEICTMALTHLLLEAEAGKNTQRIMDTLKRLENDTGNLDADPGIVLWESKIGNNIPSSPNKATIDTASPKKGPHYQKGRGSSQSDKSDRASVGSSETRKSHPVRAPGQASAGPSPPMQKPPLHSILHKDGAGAMPNANLKAQAKNVVVNAVKGAYEETGKTKPLTRSDRTTTTVRKDQYVTRL